MGVITQHAPRLRNRVTVNHDRSLSIRLQLLPPGTGRHRLDGAWWPRSHDLFRELPDLLAALDERWPYVDRIMVSRPLWRTGLSTLTLADRTVHINRSDAGESPSAICLLSYGVGRCDLLVVPPGATPAEADRLMSSVSTHDETRAGQAGRARPRVTQSEEASRRPS